MRLRCFYLTKKKRRDPLSHRSIHLSQPLGKQRLDAPLRHLGHQPHNNALQDAKQQVLVQVRVAEDVEQALGLLDDLLSGGPRWRPREVPPCHPRREHVDDGLCAPTLDGYDLLGAGDAAWGRKGVVREQGGAYGAEQVWDVRGSQEGSADAVG